MIPAPPTSVSLNVMPSAPMSPLQMPQAPDPMQGAQDALGAQGTSVNGMYFAPSATETIPFYTTSNAPTASELSKILTTAVPGPSDATNPMQVLAAQMTLLQTALSWEFASKVSGQIDSGIQALFNSQV